ncbi:hypothetical protein [Psychrobacillus phage Perkons]|nr:hypothetical protein [Psychrobacillus phage Perkons]
MSKHIFIDKGNEEEFVIEGNVVGREVSKWTAYDMIRYLKKEGLLDVKIVNYDEYNKELEKSMERMSQKKENNVDYIKTTKDLISHEKINTTQKYIEETE